MPNILSLDGGGSWALIQVRALQEIYGKDASGYTVLKDFDLVAANSGGSIVAASLAAGWPLSQTLGFFRDEAARKSVFVEMPLAERIENAVLGLGPKYYTGRKFQGLAALFGGFAGTPMDQLPGLLQDPSRVGKRVDFLITSFDYDRRRAVIFRSNTQSPAASLLQIPVPNITAAVHASSTAPVNFFNEPATFTDPGFEAYRFWDGGVSGMNNPVLIAVAEVLAGGAAPATINVLTLGTGTVRLPIFFGTAPSPLYQQAASPGTITDLKELASAIVDDPPDTATFLAYVALGRPLPGPTAALPLSVKSFVRMSPMIQPLGDPGTNLAAPSLGIQGMADMDAFTSLVNLPMDAVEDDQIDLIQALAEAWIAGRAYNQPVRSNTNLGCEIGHRFFPAALSDW